MSNQNMTYLSEFFQLASDCVKHFKDSSGGKFGLTLVAAAILAGVAWAICSKWTYLWNKRFRARPVHHMFCGMAAALTGLFVVLYPSLSHLEAVARQRIDHWALLLQIASGNRLILPDEDATSARNWATNTFLTARHEVFQLDKRSVGGKPFSSADWQSVFSLLPENASAHGQNLPTLLKLAAKNGWTLDPDEKHVGSYREDGSIIPLDGQGQGPRSEKAAEVYANGAILLFQSRYPLLSWIIWPPMAKISTEMIQNNISSWFAQNPNGVYPLTNATFIAKDQVEVELQRQAPHVVTVARWCLVGLFFLAQAIPFALIGWAAYRDLKAHRRPTVTRSRRVSTV
jgi:hypothetical protein